MATTGKPLEQSARAIAEIETESLSQGQEVLERLTHCIGTPRSVWVCLGVVFVWIALNVGIHLAGGTPPDPYPFPFLQSAGTIAAVVMTLLIFSAERRLSDSEQRRSRLMLHLTVLTEQKTAKIIELLEGLRRDDPHLHDLDDPHAHALTQPTNPADALEALDRSARQLRREN